MKSNKRSIRRHHYKRLKKQCSKYSRFEDLDIEKKKKLLGYAVNTPHPCSCSGCGNRRKHYGKTIQERISDMVLKEDLLDHLTSLQ